ncbi:MAG: class II aldolase/adducin family protein [Bacteroidota bacterium]
MPSRFDIAQQLVLICHRLYEHRFVAATDGNVSARLDNGHILVTPSATNKGQVRESDLLEIAPDGTPITLSGKASTEIDMHLLIYRRRPDVAAVVHAHPTYATGFAAARIPLPAQVLPEIIVGLGVIPLAPYATPSTKEVADSLAPFIDKSDAVLLSNHGVVTCGKDLEDAYFKMEKVEQAAHIAFVARMLGGEKSLTREELEKLRAISASSYGKEIPALPPETQESEGEIMTEERLRELIREALAGVKRGN